MHVIQESSVQVDNQAIPLLMLSLPGRTTTSIRIIVEAGATSERRCGWGIAHFLEHMAFKGTTQKSCAQIVQALARIGQANAYTSHDRTVYYIDSVAHFAQEAIQLLMEMFYESTVPEAELEKERGVILQEWQMNQDDPQRAYFTGCYEHVWPAEGHAVIGTESHIKQHSRGDILAFKARNYTPDRIAFAVVGDIPNQGRMRDLIQEALDTYGHQPPWPQLKWYPAQMRETGSCYRMQHPSTQAWLSVWYPWYTMAEVKAMDYTPYVFDNVLGDGLHSLLPTELREKRGLCYSTGCGSASLDHSRSFFLYAQLCAGKIDEALQVMNDVLVGIRDNGVDPQVVNVSRANFLVKSLHELDDFHYLARQVDRWLALRSVRGNTIFSAEDAANAISAFDDQGARHMAARLLSSQAHIITMTNAG